MLTQSPSQNFTLVLLACVLSLCSLNAFSGGSKQIKFFHKAGTDTDTYTVTAKLDPRVKCVDNVYPRSVEAVPGDDGGQTVHIHYLSTINYCAFFSSDQLFEIQSKEHPDMVAYLWWTKDLGKTPYAETDKYKKDNYGLLSIDNSDGNKIKVRIGYDGEFQ